MTIHSLIENYGNATFMGLDMTMLKKDEAYLIITNSRSNETHLYSKYKDCVNCPFLNEYGYLGSNGTIKVSTGYEKFYKVTTEMMDMLPWNSSESVFCDVDRKFGEFGVYKLAITDKDCSVEVLKEPVNIYLPILTVFIIFSVLFILLELCKYFVRKVKNRRNGASCSENDAPTKKERVKSLDTFRGITIALMIFVNYGGGDYKFIEHAVWNGLHLADLVFPWFLWIMGVCIPMSIRSTIKSNTPTSKALLRITRRSITLFLIGLFVGAGPHLQTMRIFGVLQRFSISYFVVASTCFVSMKYSSDDTKASNNKRIFADVLTIKIPWVVTITIMAVHTLILFAVPFDECPSGYLGPGGYHENGEYFNCTGGITGYIDREVLGKHLYQYAEIRAIYRTPFAFDPEGILGCLPSIVHVFIGVQAGVTLMAFKDHKGRILRWLVWATIFGIVGGVLCGFSKEDGVIPLNKHLWSLSFVFATSCFAFILLSVCYILVDVRKYWGGKPFLYAGMNAIVLYIGHSMTYSNFPIRWQWNGNQTHFLVLLENVWATSLWLLISYYLYTKKWFLTI